MSKKFRSKCFHITFYISFPYSDILLVFYMFYLFSFGIVLFELGTGLRAYDSHREHPYLRDQNREQRTKGFTRCESWPSLCGSISTANASGLVVCFLKSQRAARNDQGIHFVCFWYCIFTWFSLFTLVF